jgi:prepilin-type N-terminal cleavage/methylation domain-containing protein
MRQQAERGFTVIELLVVLTTISILSALSFSNYSEYRKRSYETHTSQMLRNVSVALEEAKGGYFAAYSDGGAMIMTTAAGTFTGWQWGSLGGRVLTGREMIPGISPSRDVRIMVSHNIWCNEASIRSWGADPNLPVCVEDWMQAYHCKGTTIQTWAVWNNGERTEMSWNNPGLC